MMRFSSRRLAAWVLATLLSCLFVLPAAAQVGGSITGTIADPTGAMIPGATVMITNAALGTQFSIVSDMQGHYTFPNVPVGRYTLSAMLSGFKPYSRALAVDVNSQVQINITLEMGEQTTSVTVTGTATQVETASTQMGEVVSADKMTTLSLNGRSYTDLLPIQPGVVPITTMISDSIIMAGVTGAVAPSGQLNPGNVSISGQRESANGFLVNGSDVQERMNGGTYRRACDEVWLLIVNDQWIGPGEVHVRAEDVATWAFDFAFDKVLIFIRPLGARSEVVELNRNG
jgi:hypothetical protein